jgi:1,4-dihydroxy-2-naphthoate octaprenyltransferase
MSEFAARATVQVYQDPWMVASAICASGDRETRSPSRAAAMFVQIRSILWARKTCDTDEQIGRGRATLISDMGDVLAAH